MAIGDSFNIREAKTSQSYAYKCWYNYNYGNNTMGISSGDIGKIITTWKDQIPSWKATAEKDENRYEIDDTGYDDSKEAGKNHAKDRTGYDGKKGGMIARGIGDAVSGIGSSAAQVIFGHAAKKATEKAASHAAASAAAAAVEKSAIDKGIAGISEATCAGATKLNEAALSEANKKTANNAKKAGFIIGCTLGLARGIAYKVKKPNKEQKEACDELVNVMNDSQAALEQTQAEMADADDAHVEMAEEAQATTEDGNDEIEDKKTTLDLYRAQYDVLMEKAKSGQPLSEDEKSFLKEVVPLMQELGGGINDTAETVHDDVSDIYEEMSDNADEVFNAASETMGEVEGATDYAESFDEATRTMCYVEGGAQTLNVASSGKAAFDAGKFAASGGWVTAWAWAFAGMGATGALFSGAGAAEQFSWAGKVDDEIDLREATQDLNSTTSEVFDERVDDFDGYMSGIEDLTIEMPKDLEEEIPTEEVQIPEQNGATPNAQQSGTTPQSGTQDKDDKDKDKKV